MSTDTDRFVKVQHNRRGRPQRQVAQRQFFQFLSMEDEGGKIGTLIKQLADIRRTAGGGVFINYKSAREASNVEVWLAEHPELTHEGVANRGAGWYVWAFNDLAALDAVHMLGRAEDQYLAMHDKYQADRRRRAEHRREQQELQRYIRKPAKEAPPAAEAAVPEPLPNFPAPTSSVPLQGAWKVGRPTIKTAEEEAAERERKQREEVARRTPMLVLHPRRQAPKEVLFEVKEPEWDAWEDDGPEQDEPEPTPDAWDDDLDEEYDAGELLMAGRVRRK